MKHNRVIAGILCMLLLAVLLACGGGGGNTTGTTASTIVGPVVSVRLETLNYPSLAVIDPTNIFTGEAVRFRLTGIDQGTVGQPRVVLPGSAWTLVGTPGGTLTTDGQFTSTSPTGNFGSVSSSYDGVTYTSSVRVVTPDAIITGLGRLTSGVPTPNIQIQALNASGTVVATGLVGSDGTIRMSAPTTAVRFTASFPSTYYVKQFAYNGKDYSTTVVGCTALLPALTSGLTTGLTSAVVFYSSFDTTPPPPPDGCS